MERQENPFPRSHIHSIRRRRRCISFVFEKNSSLELSINNSNKREAEQNLIFFIRLDFAFSIYINVENLCFFNVFCCFFWFTLIAFFSPLHSHKLRSSSVRRFKWYTSHRIVSKKLKEVFLLENLFLYNLFAIRFDFFRCCLLLWNPFFSSLACVLFRQSTIWLLFVGMRNLSLLSQFMCVNLWIINKTVFMNVYWIIDAMDFFPHNSANSPSFHFYRKFHFLHKYCNFINFIFDLINFPPSSPLLHLNFQLILLRFIIILLSILPN